MNILSVDKINAITPYRVKLYEQDGSYRFVTEHNVKLAVSFMYDDMIIQDGAYQLIIANLNNKKSPRDFKVRDTIMPIVEEFFDKNQTALLYICSTGDGKQTMRSRLFGHWFEASRNSVSYSTMSSSLVDTDGIVNEATIIVRNDNPNMVRLINAFSETAQLLSHKPDRATD